MKQIKLRPYAVAILDLFEALLDEHNIYIPDEAREGNEEEACLYGCTYYDLEDDIVNILNKFVDEIDPKHNVERITDEF